MSIQPNEDARQRGGRAADLSTRRRLTPVRRTVGHRPTITSTRENACIPKFPRPRDTGAMRLLMIVTDRVQGFNTPLPRNWAADPATWSPTAQETLGRC